MTYLLKNWTSKERYSRRINKKEKKLPGTLFKWIPLLQISIPVICAHWTWKSVLTDKKIKINTKNKK